MLETGYVLLQIRLVIKEMDILINGMKGVNLY